MIRFLITKWCSSGGYYGFADFEGKTVKDVLEEIKDFAKNKQALYIGEGFGNPKANAFGICWGIRINNIGYVSGWLGAKNEYHHELDNCIVKKVEISGGWYCFYDFYIYIE